MCSEIMNDVVGGGRALCVICPVCVEVACVSAGLCVSVVIFTNRLYEAFPSFCRE